MKNNGPKPGVYYGADADGYFDWPYLSQSQFKAFAQSPAMYKHRQKTPIEPTADMQMGSAVDCLVTRGYEQYLREYAVAPDGMKRDKRTKKYKEFLAEVGDTTVLTQDENDRVYGTGSAVMSHPVAGDWVASSSCQVAIVFDHYGVRCKALLDGYWRDAALAWDLKTSRSVTKGDFMRRVADLRYHWQAAWYMEALAFHDLPASGFGFIVACPHPTHQVETYILSDSAMAIAASEILRTMSEFKICKEQDEWPSTTGIVHDLDLPRWYYAQMEDTNG
jgi:hypothetical protein